jgi:hypothetical protein
MALQCNSYICRTWMPSRRPMKPGRLTRLPTQVCQPAVTIASTDGSEATAITMAKCLLLLPLPKHDALLSASASNPVHSLVGDSSSTKLKPPNKPPSRVCLLASALHCLKNLQQLVHLHVPCLAACLNREIGKTTCCSDVLQQS